MEDVATSADGIPLAFEVHGSEEPALVFVHGWSCDRSYWRGQLGHFAGRHRVVAVDLAGHGESGIGRRAWTMPAFGADVAAVVEKLALGDVVLIGHSMGGDVIVEAALQLGDRVRGLVWADVYNTLGEPRTREQIEEFATPFREDFAATTRDLVRQMFVPGSDAELREWVVEDMSSAPPEIAVACLEQSIANDHAMPDRLRQLPAPVVQINPDHRPTDIESLERCGVTTVFMSGVGHFLMLEDPDTFNQLLAETIEGFGG